MVVTTPGPERASSDAEHDNLRAELMRRLAHELRGPAGVTSQALRELEIALAEGRPTATLVAMMQRSVKRFVRLAERLSMAGELERGPARLELAALDLREATRAATAEAVALLSRRGIVLDLDIGADAVMVPADPRWLGVALVEVCINAIRFATRSVRVRVKASVAEAEVVVEDDGPGFGDVCTVEELGRGHGSGLGLSLRMARDILAAHTGRLTLGSASSARTGAAVTMVLPVRSSPGEAR
jgi:signal transduction histidine kinase